MENISKKRILEFLILILLFISILICSSVIILNLAKISDHKSEESIPITQRDYCILITGTPDDDAFLKQVYEGASIVSNFYDSAIQYYIPEKKSEGNSIQTLLDYAGFINADCVITCIESSKDKFIQPVNSLGKRIPLITVGLYSPQIPQLSHVGINYAELGISMAQEAIRMLKGHGTVYILNTSDYSNFYNSTLLNNLHNELKNQPNITILNSTLIEKNSLSIEDNIRQQIASSGQLDLIIALSEQGTILAAQTVLDLNQNSKTKILGFGDGKDSLTYFEKGIVTELFAPDAIDIGKKSLQEFFEYSTKGSANSYVTANIKLLKPEAAK
ncbi:substrate-binding domain-containing protein [Treponema sp.]|uniref:substrate-binding domain-containing protein n=1 Tax=Treponema sp. TaxID=166 RepID=UPI00298EB494|nr:substrate-binding domain-containing protein [Treponema sp.]MCR5612576.1 substrate-binding domain-containing protein [Treponema sp.]